MNTRISKDTLMMGTLLVAALLTVVIGSIRTSEVLLVPDATLIVVKSVTLIADAMPAVQKMVL